MNRLESEQQSTGFVEKSESDESLDEIADKVFAEQPPEATYYFAQNLSIARKMNNRKALQVLGDIAKISWSKKRLFSPHYYFKYQMYEFAADRPDDLYHYLDDSEIVKLNTSINYSISGENAVDNKMQFESIVGKMNLSVANTQRVLHSQSRPFGHYLSTVESAVEFFRNKAEYPLFCKPDKSSRSIGIFWVDAYDEANNSLSIRGVGNVDVTSLVQQMFKRFGESGYLIQTRLIQHKKLSAAAGEAIGCIRVVTLRSEDGINPVYALWKVPSSDSLADNFWRTNNIVAAIDLTSGQVIRAQLGSGIMGSEMHTHPESGTTLSGFEIPYWLEVLELARSAATLFPGVDIIGWDIGITENGPCIVEGNTNPDHGLYQLASGQGLSKAASSASILHKAAAARRDKKVKIKDRKKAMRGKAATVLKQVSSQGVSNRKA